MPDYKPVDPAEALIFLADVAEALCDGMPCLHEEGCHDHETCVSEHGGCREMTFGEDGRTWQSGTSGDCRPEGCPLGPCCDDYFQMPGEDHDVLYGLVSRARQLLGVGL